MLLDLAAEGMRRQGVLRLRIDGRSMLPLLRDGDRVDVNPTAALALQPGDLVVARIGDTLVTHRLIRRTDQGWLLKGDNQAAPDDIVEIGALLGGVSRVSRPGRDVDLTRSPWPGLNRLLALLGELEIRLAGTGFSAAGQRKHPPRLRKRWAALPPRALARCLIALGLTLRR